MNILYIAPYRQLDRWGQLFYNYLGSLNTILKINIVARPIIYNSLIRNDIDDWCLKLEEKECLKEYDYIIQGTLPLDFVYTPNSIGLTLIEPTTLKDDFWGRKLKYMSKVIVGSQQENEAAKYNKNVINVPIGIDTEIKYKDHIIPSIKQIGNSYIFYWVGEYGETTCYKEVLQSFHLEFNRKENVHLVMYFLGNPNDKQEIEKISKDLRGIKEKLGKYRNPDFYKEETVFFGCNINIIRSYHAHFDCYIDINRGVNNWSLIKEAKLFGKQIIKNNTFGRTPIIGHPVYSSKNYWRVIDINEMCENMRFCYENRNYSCYLNDCEEIKEDKMGYEYCGQKLMEILK
jgi:hypothetical protein